MNNVNWDDLRFVLAVAQAGSLKAASQELGVTHVTVMRRVAAFEERIGRKIFSRQRSGYVLLPEAASILGAAQNVEDAILSVERTIHGTHAGVSGNVRIASTDSICQKLLPEICGRLTQTHPGLTLTLLSANTPHDLARLAADIAIRPAQKLEDGLIGSIAGHLHFRLYGTSPHLESWIGMTGRLTRSVASEWMADNVAKEDIVQEADSFLVLQELAAAGVGKAFLPSYVGDTDVRLQILPSVPLGLAVPIWIASHEEMFETSRFRAVRELLLSELKRALQNYA